MSKTCDNLLIMSSAYCMWDDYKKARKLLIPHDIMSVNYGCIGTYFLCNHICSWHAKHAGMIGEMYKNWAAQYKDIITVHANKKEHGVDKVWQMHNEGGTSTLFAIRLADALKYKRIILCGAPLEGIRHFYDPDEDLLLELGVIFNRDEVRRGYSNQLGDFRRYFAKSKTIHNFKSMSGRTKELLGEPTKEWVDGYAS